MKNTGRGVESWLTGHTTKHVYPERPSGAEGPLLNPIRISVTLALLASSCPEPRRGPHPVAPACPELTMGILAGVFVFVAQTSVCALQDDQGCLPCLPRPCRGGASRRRIPKRELPRTAAASERMHTPHTMLTQAPEPYRLTQATRRVSPIHPPGIPPPRSTDSHSNLCPVRIGPPS